MSAYNSYNKLLLNWKGPNSGKNYAVGVLEKTKNGYAFQYIKNTLSEAEKEGFTPIIGLSDINTVYESEKLFSVFERRMPDPSRNVFKKFIEEKNLQHSDDIYWDYFCLQNGKLATDTLSFVVPVVYELHSNLLYFSCEVAGWTHTQQYNRNLKKDDKLEMSIDENNIHDAYAIELLNTLNNNLRVGYIPRPFNKLFYRLLKKGYKFVVDLYHINSDNGKPNLFIFSIGIPKEELLSESDLLYMIEFKKDTNPI